MRNNSQGGRDMVAINGNGSADGPREDNVIGMCQVPGLHRDLLVHIASACPHGTGFTCGRKTKRTRTRRDLLQHTGFKFRGEWHTISMVFLKECLRRLAAENLIASNVHGYYLKPRGAQVLSGELE